MWIDLQSPQGLEHTPRRIPLRFLGGEGAFYEFVFRTWASFSSDSVMPYFLER